MSKVMISDVEYETQIDHMMWTGVRIAVDTLGAGLGRELAIEYGGIWDTIRYMFNAQEYDWDFMWTFWSRLGIGQQIADVSSDPAFAERIRRQLAKFILDQIYDMGELW